MKGKIKNWWKKNWKWLCICSSILIFLINIILASIFKQEGANIFTAISGWISGVATLAVGIIAYRQSEKYKLENARYEKAQEDRAWCQDKYVTISLYRERINKCLDLFLEIEPLKSIDKLMDEILGEKVIVHDVIVMKRLDIHRSNLFLSLTMTEYYIDGALELQKSFMGFLRGMKESLTKMKDISKPENLGKDFADNAGKLLTETQKKHEHVLHQFKFYLSNLDDFLSDIALCRNKVELEKDLEERKEKQDDWVRSIIDESQQKEVKEKDDND